MSYGNVCVQLIGDEEVMEGDEKVSCGSVSVQMIGDELLVMELQVWVEFEVGGIKLWSSWNHR